MEKANQKVIRLQRERDELQAQLDKSNKELGYWKGESLRLDEVLKRERNLVTFVEQGLQAADANYRELEEKNKALYESIGKNTASFFDICIDFYESCPDARRFFQSSMEKLSEFTDKHKEMV